jgi:hypothetical protein
MSQKARFSKLKGGEVLSEQQFYTVEKITGNRVTLRTDAGTKIEVDSAYVNKHLQSASQYTSKQECTRTFAAEIFMASTGRAITVNYNKQVKEDDVAERMLDVYNTSPTATKARANFKKAVKEALVGEERTMVGRHYGEVTNMGRVQFVDMEAYADTSSNYDNRLRQVDPRTINWLIVDGVKYIVK